MLGRDRCGDSAAAVAGANRAALRENGTRPPATGFGEAAAPLLLAAAAPRPGRPKTRSTTASRGGDARAWSWVADETTMLRFASCWSTTR
jgi:hypothetical protein